MDEAWIILYRNQQGIVMLHGDGNLADWPRLPVDAPVAYIELEFPDRIVHCYYAENLEEAEAVACTQLAYQDGVFQP
ncbi:MAG: hypothetical protein GYB66_09450 [Chloroflexi bacterium]|nr:hypothetical protein [Chloroflexota bacterium]